MVLAILTIVTGILFFLGAIDELSAGWNRPASFGVGLAGLPVGLSMVLTGAAIVTRWRYVREITIIASAGMLGLTLVGGLMQQVLGGIAILLGILVPLALIARHGRGQGTALPSTTSDQRKLDDREAGRDGRDGFTRQGMCAPAV